MRRLPYLHTRLRSKLCCCSSHILFRQKKDFLSLVEKSTNILYISEGHGLCSVLSDRRLETHNSFSFVVAASKYLGRLFQGVRKVEDVSCNFST